MSDGDLVRQTLAGRPAAYEELVRRWSGRVTALCHARVSRGGVAEDLAQETLLRGYRALSSLADPEKFGAWLCGIAVRACLDWLKARERSQVNFSALGVDRDPEQLGNHAARFDEPPLEREEETQKLMAEVEALPEECREVLMLYYYQDLTYRDLAQLLGVSTATVNARLTRARALLRQRLNGHLGR